MRAATLGLAMLLGLMSLACDPDAGQEPEGAFYLEATVTVDEPAGVRSLPGIAPAVTEIRWWYRDPQHYRQEFVTDHPIIEWKPLVVVADGEELVTFDPKVGAVQRLPVPPELAPALPTALFVGPIPAPTLEEFIASLSASSDQVVARVRSDEVLGRPVEVVEYGPLWHSRSSGAPTGSATPTEVERSGGVGRLWVDEAAGFVLRHVWEEGLGGMSGRAEVTVLDLDPALDDERFTFTDAPGARQADHQARCGGPGSGGGVFFPFSPGFFRFVYAPEGWEPAGSGTVSSGGCGDPPASEWAAVRRGRDEFIVVTQIVVPPTGMPSIRDEASPIDVAGQEGYRREVDGRRYLAWMQDGIIILIESNAAPFEELLRIAESGEPVP